MFGYVQSDFRHWFADGRLAVQHRHESEILLRLRRRSIRKRSKRNLFGSLLKKSLKKINACEIFFLNIFQFIIFFKKIDFVLNVFYRQQKNINDNNSFENVSFHQNSIQIRNKISKSRQPSLTKNLKKMSSPLITRNQSHQEESNLQNTLPRNLIQNEQDTTSVFILMEQEKEEESSNEKSNQKSSIEKQKDVEK